MKITHLASLALIAALASPVAGQVVLANDNLPDDLSGPQTFILWAYFTTGEEVQIWLTSPACGTITAVEMLWESQDGTSGTSTEAEIGIFKPGTFPFRDTAYFKQRDGTTDTRILNPEVTDGAVNSFTQVGDMSIPASLETMDIPIGAGETFVITFRFANDYSLAGLGDPTIPLDIDGCVNGNAALLLPTFPGCETGCESCTLVVLGDFVLRAVMTTCTSVADSNGDCVIDVLDLIDMLAKWGVCPAPCPEDNDGSGTVDVGDLITLLAEWGACS